MSKWIFLLLLLALPCGCALLKEPQSKLTDGQKAMAAAMRSDWSGRNKNVTMKDHTYGYDPESFKASSCHGAGLFEKYPLDSLSEGDYTLGTIAYYCPPEKQYWINQYSGGAIYINRWAGPFPYEPEENNSLESH